MGAPCTRRPWSPAVDILETEDALVVKADLPNVRLEDIDVRVENQTLSIKGERRFEEDASAQAYHRIERSYGSPELCRTELRGHGESFGGL
jgi:HSP20 family protein